MTDEQIDSPGDGESRFPRWLKWGLFGALGVLVVGYGLIFLYARVLNDSPDELDEDDLAAALATEAPTTEQPSDPTDPAPTDPAPTDPSTTDPPATEPAPTTPDDTTATTEAPPTTDAPATTAPPADAGQWSITPASELGYRVKEVLFGVDTEAVGRTNQVVGGLTIEGTQVTAADFVVDVATIESDDSRRDNQFRGRIMSTDEFPEATFVLTEPIELGTEAIDGAEADTTATGELTLRGSTNPVTFDVTARLENGQIGVLGSIPVVFEDYGIANPSFAGVTTEDEGLVEFVLVFAPS